MTLCEIYWSQGHLDEAARVARQTRDELLPRFIQGNPPNIDKHLVARNRHVNALRYIERNLEALQQIMEDAEADPQTNRALGETAIRCQRHPLFDLTTELVSNHLSVTGTMVGEFESQSGLVLA